MATMGCSSSECRIEFSRIVTTALERIDLGQRHVRNERAQLWIKTKEFFLVIRSVVSTQGLVLPVDGLRERFEQRVILIAREQSVPV